MPQPSEAETIRESRAVWKLALYIVGVVCVSIVLLAVNAGMVFGLVTSLDEILVDLPLWNDLQLGGKLTQYAIFTLPVLLLYLEWHAWDVLSSTRRRHRS
jgi:hypothetical protein